MKISKAMIELMRPYVDSQWEMAKVQVRINSAVIQSPKQMKARMLIRLAGWTAEQVTAVLRSLSDCMAAGMANDEIAALLDGAAA